MRPIPPEGPGGKFDGTFIQDYEFHEGEGTLDGVMEDLLLHQNIRMVHMLIF